jgi:NAD-dependent deacetylase
MSKRIVFFTGAGVSAESGISTFRDANGLWENHRIEDVATPQAFAKNPELVLEFYNIRRRQMYQVEPNEAHKKIAELEQFHEVNVITQNIDNLHERAGSTRVLHLHGELDFGRSSITDQIREPLHGRDILISDKAADGSQLRPHVVWFGEAVPMLEASIPIIQAADMLVIIGTSLQVYPAAGLVGYASASCEIVYIDPKAFVPPGLQNIELIPDTAVEGMKQLFHKLVPHA